jgi:hypothetical protein
MALKALASAVLLMLFFFEYFRCGVRIPTVRRFEAQGTVSTPRFLRNRVAGKAPLPALQYTPLSEVLTVNG